MNLSAFTQSLQQTLPPQVSVYLQALWYDAKDQWKTAHELIDDLQDKDAFRLHAYLHRKEGDLWNADYWYKSGKKKAFRFFAARMGRTGCGFFRQMKVSDHQGIASHYLLRRCIVFPDV